MLNVPPKQLYGACLAFKGGGSPDPPPPPPPPLPEDADAAVKRNKLFQRRKKSEGFESTFLTRELGSGGEALRSPQTTLRKTLLGE
jgi:hypothetical protein